MAFVDVETTGMAADDRIISAAVLVLDTSNLDTWSLDAEPAPLALTPLHVICDPGRPSHPRAEEVHGYDDWVLRHQEPFAAQAARCREAIHGADLVVAHNASFDLRFLDAEFARAGLAGVAVPVVCTMRAWRGCREGSASLTAAAGALGFRRSGERHGALEDAWLAMMVYLHLNGRPVRARFAAIARPGPANYRVPPPRPEGPLPRRSGVRASAST